MKKPKPARRSNVTTACYDPDTKNLDVTFHNGRTYRYHDVPEKHGNGIVAAESRGSYLHEHIAKHFDFSELPKD